LLVSSQDEIHAQQYFHWAHYLVNRAKEAAKETTAGGVDKDRELGCTATNMAIESALAAEGNVSRPAAATVVPVTGKSGGDGAADAAFTAG
jgi:hypothetical protein